MNRSLKIALLFAELAMTSVQQIVAVWATMNSPQHEAYSEIYGMAAFYFVVTKFSLFHLF